MIVSKDRFIKTPRWIQAGVAGLALAIVPMGVAAVKGPTTTDEPPAAALREAVLNGAVSKEQAQFIFDTTIFPNSDAFHKHQDELAKAAERIEGAVDTGRISREDADARLDGLKARLEDARQMTFSTEILGLTRGQAHLALTRIKLERLVKAGEITDLQAKKRLEEMEKAIKLREGYAAQVARIGAKIREAVAAGEITPEQGRAKMVEAEKALKARMFGTDRVTDWATDRKSDVDWEGIRRRIEGAVERGRHDPRRGRHRIQEGP